MTMAKGQLSMAMEGASHDSARRLKALPGRDPGQEWPMPLGFRGANILEQLCLRAVFRDWERSLRAAAVETRPAETPPQREPRPGLAAPENQAPAWSARKLSGIGHDWLIHTVSE